MCNLLGETVATVLLLLVAGATSISNNTACPTVLLPQGLVRGKVDRHDNPVYLGIPYAQSTSGQNRWKPPQPLPNSSSGSIFDATAFGPTCPQAIPSSSNYSRQDEDCLNLNIWAPPSTGSELPVYVYMYGGAMVTGSSSNSQLQGNNFARKGVVYVSFNTRESLWAYPHSAELMDKGETQNFGILDVDMALVWVRTNIRAFGGDPDHVVFGGHSSGSVQVDHYLWNHPDTWLAGAVQMSANAVSGPAYAPPNVALDVVAAEVGCPPSTSRHRNVSQLECLRNASIYDIQTSYFNATSNTWFAPIIDETTRFSDYAARFRAGNYAAHVPLLTGNSDGEGTIFSLIYASENSNFSAWIRTFDADSAHIPADVLLSSYYNTSSVSSSTNSSAQSDDDSATSGLQYGDARFGCATDYMLDLRSAAQATWAYRFFGKYDNVVGVAGTAPTHGTEVPFFLGGNECFEGLANVTDGQQALADEMHDWFVGWIKDPAAGPGWDRARPVDGEMVKLGVQGEDELRRVVGSTGEYNARCQAVYKPWFPAYPVVQDPVTQSGS